MLLKDVKKRLNEEGLWFPAWLREKQKEGFTKITGRITVWEGHTWYAKKRVVKITTNDLQILNAKESQKYIGRDYGRLYAFRNPKKLTKSTSVRGEGKVEFFDKRPKIREMEKLRKKICSTIQNRKDFQSSLAR